MSKADGVLNFDEQEAAQDKELDQELVENFGAAFAKLVSALEKQIKVFRKAKDTNAADALEHLLKKAVQVIKPDVSGSKSK